jgi:hypothetical protein
LDLDAWKSPEKEVGRVGENPNPKTYFEVFFHGRKLNDMMKDGLSSWNVQYKGFHLNT